MDQSRITGESLPIEIDAGSEVHSGSINQSGAVEIRAESVGAESSFGRIIEAVRRAQESEPPVQRLADRLAAWLVYLAIGGAALTFLLTHDLTATISVVVVAGACGIAAGTPLAVLAAIARTARSGAFVKDGAHLEMLSSVDTVVFDKTGTITTGTPTVVGVHVEEGRSLPELLGYAASAESWSEHPLGQAILTRARDEGAEVPVQERDLSMRMVIGVTLASMLPIGLLLWLFVRDTPIGHHAVGMVVVSILFVLLIGLAVAGVCGYMAGLIGASNSPISGVGILIVIAAALLIKVVHGAQAPGQGDALIAYTLFTAAVVFGVATISNDNLQDLKTGQLVDSTPWKQQVALVIGVVFGAIVIPPVLSLMQGAFGFAGAPDAGDDALAAPQANLIKHLVQGVLGGDLNWSLLGLGALIGAVVIAIDEILRRTSKYSLPPLAVGMGMYLPTAVTVMIPIGAALGHLYDRWAERTANPERAKRMGTLMATGLIVGESLAGVVYAGIVVAFGGKADPLAIMPEGFAGIAPWVGVVLFVGTLWYLYRGARQESSRD